MRPSLRFLGVAVIGWIGLRAATLGALPGAEVFSVARGEAKPPAIVPTQFPPIEALTESPPPFSQAAFPYLPPQQVIVRVVPVPAGYGAATAMPQPLRAVLPQPAPQFYSQIPALDEWPLSRIAATSLPPQRSVVIGTRQSIPAAVAPSNPLDRVQLSAWALLRGRQGAILGTPSLAAGGTLGGSQAGSRLIYNFTRQIAATLRTSSNVGRRGAEVAAGIRVQPVSGVPVWLTAERRQRLGRGDGRNAFALFAETGLYQRPAPWRLMLDAYLQGGVVGVHSRDAFIDGGLTLTRPVYRQFSGGIGVWGGAQPGVYRVDAGPRVTMKLRNNLKVHVDWRQRLAGNAQPGSGPAITLAGDF
ncbi:MAG TPA: hypothetical protein VFP57_03175 [Sphingomicrobium sp.]|jgi:hypothetical protein|nr:hypothetical protein [Sphingomicrobium sp.]